MVKKKKKKELGGGGLPGPDSMWDSDEHRLFQLLAPGLLSHEACSAAGCDGKGSDRPASSERSVQERESLALAGGGAALSAAG